jgi:hypothetical protein
MVNIGMYDGKESSTFGESKIEKVRPRSLVISQPSSEDLYICHQKTRESQETYVMKKKR